MPTAEERIPAPLSPYGASKWAAEAYVNTWSLAGGIPHAVCRLGNVYGPRQSPHGEAGVVAIFSHHLYAGKTPKLYGHGAPTRDYVYVGDVVRALLAASGHRGTYNVATGVETDVRTVWDELSAAAGVQIEPQLADLRPGRAPAQLPRRLPRRARARVACGGPDRRGAARAPMPRSSRSSRGARERRTRQRSAGSRHRESNRASRVRSQQLASGAAREDRSAAR